MARSPRTSLRIEISRCRTLLTQLEGAVADGDLDVLAAAVNPASDAKSALMAAVKATQPTRGSTQGRY